MKNYIVRNCPAITQMTKLCDNACPEITMCKDITDCVMKRIVDECKDVLEQETDPLNSFEMSFAQKILQLLEIEEVDE